jgi:hypothetical protein
MNKEQACPHCGSRTFRFVGLQWWPEEVLKKNNSWAKCLHDTKHPGEGALRLFVCEGCKTSRLEPANPR